MEKENEQVNTPTSLELAVCELKGLNKSLQLRKEIVPMVLAVDNSCLSMVRAAEMMGDSLVKAQKVLAMRPVGWETGEKEAKDLWTAVTNSVSLTYRGNLGVVQAECDFLVEFSNLHGAAHKSVDLLARGADYDLACIAFVEGVDSFSTYRDTFNTKVDAFVKEMQANMDALINKLPGRESLKNARVGYDLHLQEMMAAYNEIAEIEARYMPDVIRLIREIECRKGQKAILKVHLREAAVAIGGKDIKKKEMEKHAHVKARENIETNARCSFLVFSWDNHRKAEAERAAREAEAYKNNLAAELERERDRRDELANERSRIKTELQAFRLELANVKENLRKETLGPGQRYEMADKNYQKAKSDIVATLNKTNLHEAAALEFIERGNDMVDECAGAAKSAIVINAGMKSLANELNRNTGDTSVLTVLQRVQFPLPELCAEACKTEGIFLITDMNMLKEEELAEILYDNLKTRPEEETKGVVISGRLTRGIINKIRDLLQKAPGYVNAQKESGQQFLLAFTDFLLETKPAFQDRIEDTLGLYQKQQQVPKLTY